MKRHVLLLKLLLLLASPLFLTFCIAPPPPPTSRNFKVVLNYDPTESNGNGYRDIWSQQETYWDCGPTVIKMWARYMANIAYRNTSYLNDTYYGNAFNDIPSDLDAYTQAQYDPNDGYNSTTYNPLDDSTIPLNEMDNLKVVTGKPNLMTKILDSYPGAHDNQGTFVWDPAVAISDPVNIKYTALFTEFLYRWFVYSMYFRFCGQDNYDSLMQYLCQLYPYPPDPATNPNGQSWFSQLSLYNGGPQYYPYDYLVDFYGVDCSSDSSGQQNFAQTLVNYASWQSGNYQNSNNYWDKAIEVVINPNVDPNTGAFSGTVTSCGQLHYVLVIGYHVYIPAGYALSWQNVYGPNAAPGAYLNLIYLDPDPTTNGRQIEMPLANFIKMATLTKDATLSSQNLMAYTYLAAFLGQHNWIRDNRAITRGLSDVQSRDFVREANDQTMRKRRWIAKHVLPIIYNLLLDGGN